MTNKLFATILAASMAFTSVFSAPARAADSGEIARTILGAGALLYLGNELSKNNNNNRGYTTRRYVEPRYNNHRHRTDRRHRVERKVVPSSCLRENNYRNGPRRYFGQRCLYNNMRNANRLPSSCRATVPSRNGHRTVYAARCLRQNGWTFG